MAKVKFNDLSVFLKLATLGGIFGFIYLGALVIYFVWLVSALT